MKIETAQRSEIPGETESEIVIRHDKLIRHMAIPFADRGVELDDLVQDARIALIQAARTWLPSGGASLWTYAYKFVYAAISRRKTREIEEPASVGLQDSGTSVAISADGALEEAQLITMIENLGDDTPSAERLLELAELVAISSSEMISLSEIERRVVRLRFVDELHFPEIALALDLSSNDKAERIYHGAVSKLRERMGARV